MKTWPTAMKVSSRAAPALPPGRWSPYPGVYALGFVTYIKNSSIVYEGALHWELWEPYGNF